MTDSARDAAREAAAHGATPEEIAEAMGEHVDTVAAWLATESRRRDIDPWDLVQELVADAQAGMARASASGDSAAYKSLAATVGRLAPVLARLEESRREDGIKILPSELAAAETRVRGLVDAALRGAK